MEKITIAVTVGIGCLVCGTCFAGPADNAQQFQQKAARSAMQKQYDKTTNLKGQKDGKSVREALNTPSNFVNTGTQSAADKKKTDSGR